MKNPLTLIVVFALIANTFAAPTRNSLDFYLSDPNKYLGSSINLSVSHVDPLTYRGKISNVVFFNVYTSSENGIKSIPLAVDAKKSKEFADYYGTKIAAKPSAYRQMTGKFRFVDTSMQESMQTFGLGYIGFTEGSYFIDATTEGQLDTVFNWYPEKTAALKEGKNIQRVSAKEGTEKDAIRASEMLLEDKEKESGKKAHIVKQEISTARDKKICVIEFLLEQRLLSLAPSYLQNRFLLYGSGISFPMPPNVALLYGSQPLWIKLQKSALWFEFEEGEKSGKGGIVGVAFGARGVEGCLVWRIEGGVDAESFWKIGVG